MISSFQILSDSLFTNHANIRRWIIWDIDKSKENSQSPASILVPMTKNATW
jgi:hypothetical protein